jgi:phage shock protein PspC (stress-responsive transcriptional regulator)
MKRLYRSKKNRLVAGVFGGIAEYFNINAKLLRLIFVLPAFVIGLVIGLAGVIEIILYLIAYLIIPEEA